MASVFATNTQKVTKYGKLQVSTSQLDIPIMLMWGQRRTSPNVVWYNDFKAHKVNPKGKGSALKGATQYTYTAAVICALGEGPFDSCANVWQNGSTTTADSLAHFGYDLKTGTASQAPESFVTTKYPAEALAYAYTGYVFHPNLNLGSSAAVPNDAFEMVRLMGFTDTLTAAGYTNPVSHAVTNGTDCSLADIIPDLLTNVQYGFNFAGGDIGSLTSARQYWAGQGFYFSPKLDNQEKVNSILDRWAILGNTWIFWDGLQVRFVPLGDSAVGAYTPDLTAAYNLTVSAGDFLDNPPVSVTRKDPADCYNRTAVEFCDRTRGYVTNPAVWKDQTLVDQFGIRDNSSTQADEICNPAVAAVVVQLIGKRAGNIRKSYAWRSPYRYIRLLPGSIVTLTSPNQGLDHEFVRIMTVDEDPKTGALAFTAQELAVGVNTYVGVSQQGNGPQSNPAFNQDPGNVNTPAIVEPNSALTGFVQKLLISASGGAQWGGCNVHLSFDNGASYNHVGTISAGAPQGVLTANFASFGGTNPDVGNTLSVDGSQSLTIPQPVTNADAQAFRSLCVIAAQPVLSGGFYVMPTNYELAAFGAVATTGTYTANLTYWERGLYGTPAGAHVTGDQWSMLDVSGTKLCTLAYTLPPQYIGVPVCVKLTSFNTFGLSEQDISVVTAYKYTPTGAGYGGGTSGVPSIPTGLAAAPGVNQNVISWNSNPPTDNVTAYKVYRAPGLGAAFGSASLVAPVGTTNTWTDPGRPSGAAYTYFLIATNAVGDGNHTSGVNCTTGSPSGGSLRIANGTPGRKPTANEEIANPTMLTGDVFPWDGGTSFLKSYLTCETAPTSSFAVLLKKNGATVATGTIAAAATSGTWAGLSADITFTDGDKLTVVCPSVQDATLSGLSYLILGTRTQ